MEQDKENPKNQIKKKVILLVAKIVLLILFVVIVFFVLFGVTRMGDPSMYPSVHDGDLLFYYRLENRFNNGDIVIVDRDGTEEVLRIIASPGQTLDISDEGELTINGQPSSYVAFYETHRAEQNAFKYPYIVSDNCYFMLNDYRSNTNDSRTFGEVCRDNIKGRLIAKIQIRDF